MSMRHAMAGEGASMPWVRPEGAAWSGMVVCPMLAIGSDPGSGWALEIYRLAYERAQAVLRPSAYEIAGRASLN
jgi:hypothetical protein